MRINIRHCHRVMGSILARSPIIVQQFGSAVVPRGREDGRVRHPIGRITFLALKEVSEQVVLNLYRASASECLAQCWSWKNEVPEKSVAITKWPASSNFKGSAQQTLHRPSNVYQHC